MNASKIKKILVAFCATMTAFTLNAQITTIFNDNFNLSGTGTEFDANVGIAERQSGGLLTSTYTEAAGTQIVHTNGEGVFNRTAGTASLDTNFGPQMGAYDFTLSFDLKMNSTTENWTNITLSSASPLSIFGGPMSLFVYGAPMGGNNTVISLRTGTEGAHTGLSWSQSQLDGFVGGTFDVNAINAYSFVATATDANSGTFDFLINGSIVRANQAYAFSGSDRRIHFSVDGATTNADFDNLTLAVIPEPTTTAVGIGLATLFVVMLRRRIRNTDA